MKKKIVMLATFVIALVVVLCNLGTEKVNAEETGNNSCQVYTNYYLYMDAIHSSWYDEEYCDNNTCNGSGYDSTKGVFYHETAKEFSLGAPVSEEDAEFGAVEITLDDTTDYKKMGLEEFYNAFSSIEDNIPSEAITESDGSITRYIRAIKWETTNATSTTFTDICKTYDEFKTLVPTGDSLNGREFTSGSMWNKETFYARIYRTWEKEDVAHIENKTVFSPAVYYVRYEICGEEQDVYKTTAHYFNKETNEKLKEDLIWDSGLKTGDSYEGYTCPEAINDKEGNKWILSANDGYEYKGGTIEDKDIDFNCYYTEEKESVTLTINFGTNKDCTEGTDIHASVSKTYTEGDKVVYRLPTIENYEFSNIGPVSPVFSPKPSVNTNDELTFTMPGKNTSVCLVYIKNQQTGSGWVYLAWVIAIAALAYSVWYFIKYNKTRNSEI